jgi:hypothetical protein
MNRELLASTLQGTFNGSQAGADRCSEAVIDMGYVVRQ